MTTNEWQASEAFHHALFEASLSGVALCRMIVENGAPVDFLFLSVNKAFSGQTGLVDVIGRKASEFFPDLRAKNEDLLRIFHQVAEGGDPVRCERYFAARDAWFSISSYGLHSGDFIATFDAITERKREEMERIERDRRLRRVLDGSQQGYWDWNLREGRVAVSPSFEAMMGYAPGEMAASGKKWGNYVHPHDLARVRAAIKSHRVGKTPALELETRCRTKSGEWRWLQLRGGVVERGADGRPSMMSGTFIDIMTRKQYELSLRQAVIAFENTRDGMAITDGQARIESVNRAFTEISGFTLDEVRGKVPTLLPIEPQNASFFSDIRARLRTQGYWQGELRARRKNGEAYPQLTTINAVRDDNGEIIHYIAVFTDLTSIRDSQEQLEFLAQHDSLTGLPNRPLLFSRLERAMTRARGRKRPRALLLIDLDRFKDINDSFGHLAGDNLLQQIAQRLKDDRHHHGLLARLGGDEFAIWLERLDRPEDAGRIAGEILALLDAPWYLPNGAEVRVAASIGIAAYPGSATTPEELLQQADAAMYQAKKEGRSSYIYFSTDLTDDARERITLESRLRHAIEEGELQLRFQPQIDIASGRLIGAEALANWDPKDSNGITSSRFIPLAEETGLIFSLGRRVLRETCAIGRRWIDAGYPPLLLAVNASTKQLQDPDFVNEVFGIVKESGFPATSLEIEITESSLMSSPEHVVSQLEKLRAHGIRIAVDDFGTGYSSLAYLKRFPLDVLKIDRSFVEHLSERNNDREIVTAIIQMGHTLGFRVLAEGVETAGQLAFLKEKGCDIYQGYLGSRPLPAEEFEAFMRDRPE